MFGKKKVCSKCGETKSVREFYKNKNKKDGLCTQCKQCKRNYELSEKGKEVRKKYDNSDKGRLAHKKHDHSEKRHASREAYRKSDKGRASVKKYRQSDKGVNIRREYQRSDKSKSQQRVYRQTDDGRLSIKKSNAKYRANNREQVNSQAAVNKAVKQGKTPHVSTQICADCGTKAQEYHHESYAKKDRLDVVPLCSMCHKQRHI